MGERLPAVTEAVVQKGCLAALRMLGVFHWRNNTGAVKSEYQGRKRFTRFGVPGAPDIMALWQGRFYGIEIKRPLGPKGGERGSALTPEQIEFGAAITRNGGVYIIARSADEMLLAMGLTSRIDAA